MIKAKVLSEAPCHTGGFSFSFRFATDELSPLRTYRGEIGNQTLKVFMTFRVLHLNFLTGQCRDEGDKRDKMLFPGYPLFSSGFA
jgi:hypothetical protein